jgi:hypothetical protein
MSRFLEGALVTSELSSFEDAIATSATAQLKAFSFTAEGLANPLIFLTNCRAAACISSSVAGGLKLYSTLMFLHTLFTSVSATVERAPDPRLIAPFAEGKILFF